MTRYTITIEAMPRPDDPTGVRRVRIALKRLLRGLHLKCIEAKPEREAQPLTNSEGIEREIPQTKRRTRQKRR